MGYFNSLLEKNGNCLAFAFCSTRHWTVHFSLPCEAQRKFNLRSVSLLIVWSLLLCHQRMNSCLADLIDRKTERISITTPTLDLKSYFTSSGLTRAGKSWFMFGQRRLNLNFAYAVLTEDQKISIYDWKKIPFFKNIQNKLLKKIRVVLEIEDLFTYLSRSLDNNQGEIPKESQKSFYSII